MIKIAIQKSGRLHDESLDLLKKCGVTIKNYTNQLRVKASDFPIELVFLRNGDIPKYIKNGVVDIGIIGSNLILEKANELKVIKELGYSKCRVSLAIPKEQEYNSIADFEGKKIATSYPNTLKDYLKSQNISCEIHIINGSVEVAPSLGLADAICDIVSSGGTLRRNQLKEVDVIHDSQAVLVQSPNCSSETQALIEKLLFRIDAVQLAGNMKYILMNVSREKIEKVAQILPGLKQPTVLPHTKENWCSIHSVIKKDKIWDVIEELKKEGAEDILICPIDNIIL